LKKQVIQLTRPVFLVFAVMLAFVAAPRTADAEQSGVPLPTLSKAVKGEQCVEPANIMRREHMNFLTHQRDETLREGIRGKKYSLQQCTECHATADPEIEEGKVRTLQPFCTQCHEYAAVKLDCFACHNPTLPLDKSSRILNKPDHEIATLQQMIVSHLSEGITATPEDMKNQKETSQ